MYRNGFFFALAKTFVRAKAHVNVIVTHRRLVYFLFTRAKNLTVAN